MAASADRSVPTHRQPARAQREEIFHSGNGVSVYRALNAVGERSSFKAKIVLKLLNYIIKYNYEIVNCFEDCVIMNYMFS